MDLLDLWKTHICANAHFLFLFVPFANVRSSGQERVYETVITRLESFFTDAKSVNVDAAYIFGYGPNWDSVSLVKVDSFRASIGLLKNPRQELWRGFLVEKAAEGIRTLDIHVGKVNEMPLPTQYRGWLFAIFPRFASWVRSGVQP